MPATSGCCVCGYVGTLKALQCDNVSDGTPFFPCLKVTSMETFLSSTAKDSHSRLVCLLCHRLFLEQWDNFERNKTPLAARQYWLKGVSLVEDHNSFSPPEQLESKSQSPQKRSVKDPIIVARPSSKSPAKKPPKPKVELIEETVDPVEEEEKVCVECGNHFRLKDLSHKVKICDRCRSSAASPPQ